MINRAAIDPDWVTMSDAERSVALYRAASTLECWSVGEMGSRRDDTITKLVLHAERPYASAGSIAAAAIEAQERALADATRWLAEVKAAVALLGITPEPRKAINA